SVEDAGVARVAVAAARANVHAAVVQFDLESVAAAFGRFRGNVAQQVKLILLAGDALQSAKKIVGVENRKAAGAFGERREHLLVGRNGRRKLRNDGAGLAHGIVGVVVVVGGKTAAISGRAAAAARPSGGTACAARAAACSTGTACSSRSAARTAA